MELLPLLESDLCQYYKDQLVLESDHADMVWCKKDEKVLAFLEKNIEEYQYSLFSTHHIKQMTMLKDSV